MTNNRICRICCLFMGFFGFIANSDCFCERHESVDLYKMWRVYLEAGTYSENMSELGWQRVRSVSLESLDVFV
jgi:hypothetical protein